MQEFREWVAKLPAAVRETAKAYPPNVCYRSQSGRGHYAIMAYTEPDAGNDKVTVRLMHGSDSFAPGFHVFGVPPEDLVACACGAWEQPTAEQTERARARVSAMKQGHRGH